MKQPDAHHPLNYLNELSRIKVNKSGTVISLHKPLLLLLVISKVMRGGENLFLFDAIEEELKTLISKYGLKNTQTANPQYPFVYLASSPALWECSVSRNDIKIPDAVSRREVLGKTAQLNKDFLHYLSLPANSSAAVRYLLDAYWPEAYHQDILSDLGLSNKVEEMQVLRSRTLARDRSFVLEVLDAYERKCAICGYSIRLGDTLIGIDACHLKPIQHFGDDHISNGLALCKLHHWALDRGAISINSEYEVMVSQKLNGFRLDDFFVSYERKPIHIPRNGAKQLNAENINYHNRYVFVKG